MTENHEPVDHPTQRITVEKNGPYVVQGHVPLVRKTQVVSEHGEPLTWQKGETLPAGETYRLCRCGQSGNKPFCDDTHLRCGFDGTETAEINTTAERRVIYKGGTGIVVRRDYALCMEAGFCGNRLDQRPEDGQAHGRHPGARASDCDDRALSVGFVHILDRSGGRRGGA